MSLRKNEDNIKEQLKQIRNTLDILIKQFEMINKNQTDVEMNNLIVNSLTQLTILNAQIVSITNSLSVPSGVINDLSSCSFQAIEANIETLNVAVANIESWIVENLTLNNLILSNKITSNSLETKSANIRNLSSDDISVIKDIKVSRNLNVKENVISDSIMTNKILTENITWKSFVLLSNIESFFIEVPHFENGQYYIQLVDDFTSFATIEIFNSVDNYFVRWSQSENGNIQNIFKHGDGVSSRIFIEFKNTSGKSLKLKYGTICMNLNENYKIHKLLNIKPDITYKVKHVNGGKFFENIDFTIDKQQIIDIIREINPTIFIDELRNKEDNKTEKPKKRKNHDGRIIRK